MGRYNQHTFFQMTKFNLLFVGNSQIFRIIIVSICGLSESAHFLPDDSEFDLLLIKTKKMMLK